MPAQLWVSQNNSDCKALWVVISSHQRPQGLAEEHSGCKGHTPFQRLCRSPHCTNVQPKETLNSPPSPTVRTQHLSSTPGRLKVLLAAADLSPEKGACLTGEDTETRWAQWLQSHADMHPRKAEQSHLPLLALGPLTHAGQPLKVSGAIVPWGPAHTPSLPMLGPGQQKGQARMAGPSIESHPFRGGAYDFPYFHFSCSCRTSLNFALQS